MQSVGRGVVGAGDAIALACHRVTPEEEQELVEAKAAIKRMLGEFEEAVQSDDLEKLIGLLSPVLDEGASQEVESDIKDALRAFTYSDYKLYYESAIDGLKWREIVHGRIVLNLRFRSGSGRVLKDRFVLRRSKGKWLIGDVHLRRPVTGDPLDLPPHMRDQILSKVETCVLALRAGDEGFGNFITAFEPRRRHTQDIDKHRKTQEVWLAGVQLLFQSIIRDVQFSRERTRIIHQAPGRVHVAVPVTFKYPPTGPAPFRQTLLAFVLIERGDKWLLVDMSTLEERGWFSRLFLGG